MSKKVTCCKSGQYIIEHTTYIRCNHCGRYYSKIGELLVEGSERCPSWVHHHHGALCLTCGNDERKSNEWNHLTQAELAPERIKAGLSEFSEYLQRQENKYRTVELILRTEQAYAAL